ncbi:hypothetical protein [Paeniglutamicibacter kerguelensis]|uniref:DUF2946 domain-containing protein n=1 Tax=Paeniglutamicibacter kerguelensis TaxID=254788 RepID=A0ABS4XHL0_9MICC|nr:hypothetical protein [Paeniglutamicibacter kerguelensis]MBP2387957.1 hypothetical protein [Paeniglutamicibacter kerguelensis]
MGIGKPLRRRSATLFLPLPALLGLVLLILGLMGMHTIAGNHAGPSMAGSSVTVSASGGNHHHSGPADHAHDSSVSSPATGWADLECPSCCGDMPQAAGCDLAPVAGSMTSFFLPVFLVLPGDLGLRGPPPVTGATEYIPPPPSLIELSISRT